MLKSIIIFNISGGKTMAMSNNDILKRVRYALDIRDIDMVEIFKLGGMEVTKEDVVDMLTKIKRAPQHEAENDDVIEDEYVKTCDMMMLEAFFNGFITLKEGSKIRNHNNRHLYKAKRVRIIFF